MFALSCRVLFHLFRPNIIQSLLAVSRWLFLDHRCGVIRCNVCCLPLWYLFYFSKHCVHSMPPEFFFVWQRYKVQPLPR